MERMMNNITINGLNFAIWKNDDGDWVLMRRSYSTHDPDASYQPIGRAYESRKDAFDALYLNALWTI